MTTMHRDQLSELCRTALAGVGADARTAQILADATVEAELVGNRAVGVAHLFDYLDGYRQGRISTDPDLTVRRVAPAVLDGDADGGLAQAVFAAAADDLHEAIRAAGIAALWIKNSFTCGELGYYPRHLAEQGFLAVAVANSPALMSVGGAPHAVLGTNPLAYAVPRPGQLPVVIDQASSSTAFVNIRRSAENGESIPAGWALGPDGTPTDEAQAALVGTLLPFGGHRGGNIAVLVEILATLSGAAFSLDAAPFDLGADSPGIGVFVLGIDPATFGLSVDRLNRQLDRLRTDHAVRLPAVELTELPDTIDLTPEDLRRLQQAAGTRP